MKERVRFIDEWERGDLTMVALCRKYGVSRQTGYIAPKAWEIYFGPVLLGIADYTRPPPSTLTPPRRTWKKCQP